MDEYLIIGGEIDLIGQSGHVIESHIHERLDETHCVIVQLSCAPFKNGRKLFFLPEHVMPLTPDESIDHELDLELAH